MTRKNGSTDEQIRAIMATEFYKRGSDFTLVEMLYQIPSIKCRHRMSVVLTEMYSRCLLDKRSEGGLMRYSKPVGRLLRKRWISEVAEDLCARDYPTEIAGQAARDVSRRARALAATNQTACGGGI